MFFEHDALVVYLKDVHPKLGDEDADFPTLNITLQVSKGDAGEHWEAVLASFMSAPGGNEETEFAETVQALGAFFDGPLKLHRSFESHTVNFWQSTNKLVSIENAKVHKAKIEWANDHHDERILLQIQAMVPGADAGTLTNHLGHKLRLESVCPQEALDLE